MHNLHGGTIAAIVDLGGSLAVASKGLFATGVSTDLNVTYMSSGGIEGKCAKSHCSDQLLTSRQYYKHCECIDIETVICCL